jgi:hypothetical protein
MQASKVKKLKYGGNSKLNAANMAQKAPKGMNTIA